MNRQGRKKGRRGTWLIGFLNVFRYKIGRCIFKTHLAGLAWMGRQREYHNRALGRIFSALPCGGGCPSQVPEQGHSGPAHICWRPFQAALQ